MLSIENIIRLLQLRGIGRKSVSGIIENTKDRVISNDADFKMMVLEAWQQVLGKKKEPKFNFDDAFYRTDEIISNSRKQGINIISFFDNTYPSILKNMTAPPIILNYKGDINILNPKEGITIIGTREPTQEGYKVGKYIAGYLGEQGFNIVSGLAKGCDTSAHEGCLSKKGCTTAVLAHGLHTIYPKSNKDLAQKILSNDGLLLSEYFIGVDALKNYFVERDRLQAGLSKATVVIQHDNLPTRKDRRERVVNKRERSFCFN